MRKLTEKGFMEGYLQSLSLNNTSSVNKLIKELPNNPRLLVPLAYYAHIIGLPEKTANKSSALASEIEKIKTGQEQAEIQKLLNTYKYAAGKKSREDHLKRLMHKKLLEKMAEKGITTYKVYKALNLDPSNTNRFVKHCDCSRINIDSVRKMVKYVEEI